MARAAAAQASGDGDHQGDASTGTPTEGSNTSSAGHYRGSHTIKRVYSSDAHVPLGMTPPQPPMLPATWAGDKDGSSISAKLSKEISHDDAATYAAEFATRDAKRTAKTMQSFPSPSPGAPTRPRPYGSGLDDAGSVGRGAFNTLVQQRTPAAGTVAMQAPGSPMTEDGDAEAEVAVVAALEISTSPSSELESIPGVGGDVRDAEDNPEVDRGECESGDDKADTSDRHRNRDDVGSGQEDQDPAVVDVALDFSELTFYYMARHTGRDLPGNNSDKKRRMYTAEVQIKTV